MENEIMELILDGGDARTKAIEAMNLLKDNEFDKAREVMKECNSCIVKAHRVQTRLLQNEAGGEGEAVKLLMVHAQDHLMDAMVIRDIVISLIDIQENNYRLIQQATR